MSNVKLISDLEAALTKLAITNYSRRHYKIYTKDFGIVTPENEVEGITNIEWHREDGPAVLLYEGSKVVKEYWYFDDTLHRIGGPSIIDYKTLEKYYHINGKTYSEQSYISLMIKMKIDLV